MTSISFTSGEILDIMDSLQLKAQMVSDPHLAVYYESIVDQFQLIYDKLQDFVPENRVANLVLAVN